jgi:organizing structure protein 2
MIIEIPYHAAIAHITQLSARKPIYDDGFLEPPPPTSSAPSPPKSSAPTPTDRLTSQVARARLFLHKYAAKTEDAANDALTKSFDLEKSFTSTVASLAPPKTANEQLVPGLIYVLVSAMGSSILVRNRNILLRASVPFAVGIGAGYYFIPITMRNVGDLVWKYESKYPVLADTHTRVKDRVTRFVETGIAHTKMSVGIVEDKVGEVRENVENWVSKGK